MLVKNRPFATRIPQWSRGLYLSTSQGNSERPLRFYVLKIRY